MSNVDLLSRLEALTGPSREVDADETDGRRLYRSRANALANAQINISKRVAILRARETEGK